MEFWENLSAAFAEAMKVLTPVFTALVLAVGLSADAFAVSISKGLAIGKARPKHMLVTGAWFGAFQALMPLIGYFISYFIKSNFTKFEGVINNIDHWLAFILLALIGANMIKEAFSKEEESTSASLSFRVMLIMAIATSIDALAAGVSIGMGDEDANIWLTVALIGIITFALSALGVKFGSFFGARYKRTAEIAGGVILIILGLKMVIEHLIEHAAEPDATAALAVLLC